ncbi:spermidine synthase [Anoxybacter fermentans]|uniref:Polyamine aminopropyltransferase n=1 Tax=Anoxybacter fermentans TaxID=1323375 RepID=A0A3Q9HRI2_9FIRM|nr:polyamine aminopropyltransferase [Anoxybacter fermentans]AZR73815.1 spermidine synthase [Anoxybacter fermentans]
MELWFTEYQNNKLAYGYKISKHLHSEQTKFQRLDVVDTEQFGRMLILDGIVMTTIEDEFVYHEMISHVPLITHPNPKKVAVIGGGDGGAIREIIKHPSIEEAHLIEIDGRVIENSKKYLPEIACALDDPKVTIFVEDGIEFIKKNKNTYDVIMVDSTDPIGPAVGLFKKEFYQSVYDALKEDGLFVAQTESPFLNKDIIKPTYQAISEVFPITRLYLATIPTYPGFLWSFSMGSKKYKPEDADLSRAEAIASDTKYYNPEIHRSAFALPNFVRDLIAQK